MDIIDISRKNKHKFSNPFNSEKLGYHMAYIAFLNHIKKLVINDDDRGKIYVCNDKDCPSTGFHIKLVKEFTKK